MDQTVELVVTDLDNTLYDWVTFFTSAFYEMVRVGADLLETPGETLLDELQAVHRRHHNSEQPFALLETPSVMKRFPELSRQERAAKLDAAFHAFNRVRNQTLKLYPGVGPALQWLGGRCVVVGHTEATIANAVFRLKKLGIDGYLSRLYALEHAGAGHPDPERARAYEAEFAKVRLLAKHERKPDVRVLFEICRDQGVPPDRTVYVGDSIARDIGMAKAAGTWAAWAKYGTSYDPELWKKLVRITHWTREDVERAEQVERLYANARPDVVLRRFDELIDHFAFRRSTQ